MRQFPFLKPLKEVLVLLGEEAVRFRLLIVLRWTIIGLLLLMMVLCCMLRLLVI